MIRLFELAPDAQTSVRTTRKRAARLHAELPANDLIVWMVGDVSERVQDADLFAIKSSGVYHNELSLDNTTVCMLEEEKIDNGTPPSLSPSSDTAAVVYVFRYVPEVGRAAHTYSIYAAAFATLCRPTPCVLTMMGNELGGEVPTGPSVITGDDSTGRGIVETFRPSRSSAMLMANHGPFTVGKSIETAIKATVMIEEIVHIAATVQLLGDPMPVIQNHIDASYQGRQNVYGQC